MAARQALGLEKYSRFLRSSPADSPKGISGHSSRPQSAEVEGDLRVCACATRNPLEVFTTTQMKMRAGLQWENSSPMLLVISSSQKVLDIFCSFLGPRLNLYCIALAVDWSIWHWLVQLQCCYKMFLNIPTAQGTKWSAIIRLFTAITDRVCHFIWD